MKRRWILLAVIAVLAIGLFGLDHRLRQIPSPQPVTAVPVSTHSVENTDELSPSAILDLALERWSEIDDYQCTITSINRTGAQLSKNILAVVYKRPCLFRHAIVDGHNQGVLLTYNGKVVHARPGGLLSMMTVQMDPRDQRLLDGRGRPFFQTDWGSELTRFKEIVDDGGALSRGPDEEIDEEPCWQLRLQVPGPLEEYHSLWINSETHLVQRISSSRRGQMLRDASYSNIALNVSPGDAEFSLK